MLKIFLFEVFFFVFGIGFGEAEQKVITFVAAALKVLLAVAETDGRLTGSQLYSGYIFWSFLNILVHTSSVSI